MILLRQSVEALLSWFDSVAATLSALFDRIQSTHHVQVVEDELGTFTFRVLGDVKNSNLPIHHVRIAGGSIVDPLPQNWVAALRASRIELILRSSRFMFRPLELPKRAAEYLDGIVRSQIDRLTPWTASEAVYGWTPPIDATGERVRLTIAATARAMVSPYFDALTSLNPASIAVATTQSDSESKITSISFLEHRRRGSIHIARIRSILMIIFLVSGLSAAASIAVSAFATANLSTEQQELLRKISARKAAIRSLSGGSILQALEKRKQTTPSTVMVLEALSGLLPDDAYVTELRVEGEKLQIVGITSHAPALIQLIERSPHFSHATFFAPTTQLPGSTREQFHIEAHINPVFAFGS